MSQYTALNIGSEEGIFQVEKQGKLNQLQVIVVLKIHQIEYLVSNVLPNDLSEALVFERNGLVRLQNRIHELNDEKLQQSRKQKLVNYLAVPCF